MQISALNVQFNCKHKNSSAFFSFSTNDYSFVLVRMEGRKEGIFIPCTILNIIHLQWWVVLLTLVIQNSPPRRRQTLWEDHHGQSGTISKWFPSPVRKNYPLEWEFLSPIKETLYHCPSSIDAEKMKEIDEPDFTFPPPTCASFIVTKGSAWILPRMLLLLAIPLLFLCLQDEKQFFLELTSSKTIPDILHSE